MVLTHEVAGTGPAVVLLHSSAADAGMWDPQWTPLAGAHRVVRCDLRGFGASPLPAEAYSDAEDVVGLLDALGRARVSLVGASFGGRIALEIASNWPDRVERLVLLCAGAGLPPGEELTAFGAKENALLEAGDVDGATELNVDTWLGPEASEQARALVRAAQRRSFETWLAADPEPDVRHRDLHLDRVTAPALVVAGDHDVRDFRDAAVHLAATLPDARHLALPWAGHLPNLERPDEVTALILDFLTTRG